MQIDVEHLAPRGRFQAHVDGLMCVCDYRLSGGVMHMIHTEVPAALQGRGVAAALVKAALDHARAASLKVDPQCSYVSAYMARHPETADLLV